MSDEKPTVAIKRDLLAGLVAESTPVRPHVRTVPRNELAAGTFDDVHIDNEEGVSPTLVLGVILLLVVVFVVVVQLR